MRTVRSSSHLYPSMHWAGVCVYPSMHWAGGVCIPARTGQEGVCPVGVSAQGVSAWEGMGCLAGIWGASAHLWMCIPACTEADTPLNRMTDRSL